MVIPPLTLHFQQQQQALWYMQKRQSLLIQFISLTSAIGKLSAGCLEDLQLQAAGVEGATGYVRSVATLLQFMQEGGDASVASGFLPYCLWDSGCT